MKDRRAVPSPPIHPTRPEKSFRKQLQYTRCKTLCQTWCITQDAGEALDHAPLLSRSGFPRLRFA